MHIVQIISHYVPANRYGGPQHVAHGIGKALVKAGHNVTVCTTNLADEINNLEVSLDVPVLVDGITVYYEPVVAFRYWGFSPKLWYRAAKEIENADIVLVHFHYQFASLAGSFISRYHKKPFVVFTHGSLNKLGISHKNSKLKQEYINIFELG